MIFRVLLFILLAPMVAVPCDAQMFVEDTNVRLITAEEVTAFTDRLGDPNKSTLIKALHDDYGAEVTRAWQQYQEGWDALRLREQSREQPAEGGVTLWSSEALQLAKTQRSAAEELRERFVEDVRLILGEAPERLALWDEVVRVAWRRRMLANMNPSSVNAGVIDLVSRTRELPFSDAELRALQEYAAGYYSRLDGILQRYHDEMIRAEDQLEAIRRRLAAGEERALAERREVTQRSIALFNEVIELNCFAVAQVAAALAPQTAPAWQALVDQTFNNALFVPGPVDRIAERLEEIELDDAVMAQVTLAYDQYQQERAGLRRRISDALAKWSGSKEAKQAQARFEELRARQKAGDKSIDPMMAWSETPTIPLLKRLRELEERTTDRLRSLLSSLEDQLPVDIAWLLRWHVGFAD